MAEISSFIDMIYLSHLHSKDSPGGATKKSSVTVTIRKSDETSASRLHLQSGPKSENTSKVADLMKLDFAYLYCWWRHLTSHMCWLHFCCAASTQGAQPLSHEQNVRPSVRLSNAWIVKKNEINLCRHSYTTWKIIHPSFLASRTVAGGRPLLPEILGRTDSARVETVIFNRYSVVAPQP